MSNFGFSVNVASILCHFQLGLLWIYSGSVWIFIRKRIKSKLHDSSLNLHLNHFFIVLFLISLTF